MEINCALATPLDARGGIDVARLRDHIDWLDARGCAAFGVLGTTGEGQSFSLTERKEALEALLRLGVAPGRLVVGTGCASIVETIDLSLHAAALGCRDCLVLPPFLFNEPGDDGLRAAFDPLLDRLAGTSTGAIVYHIPKFTGVTISPALLARLSHDHPRSLAGVKDSGGDWTHSRALLEAATGIDVYIGNELDLTRPELVGIRGTISGLANVIPTQMRGFADGEPGAEAHVQRVVAAVRRHPVVPAIKALVARVHGDPSWAEPRPPLSRLPAQAVADLEGALDDQGPPDTHAAASAVDEG